MGRHFSYGETFLEINSQLLKRYAACATEEDVKRAEATWLAKIEREYAQSRAERETEGANGAWAGGNRNRRSPRDSDDEEEEGDEDGEGESEDGEGDDDAGGGVALQPHGIDLEDEDGDDEEEMAELRRRVLAAKPFANPSSKDDKPVPATIARPTPAEKKPLQDSDAESGSDLGEDDAFDNIIDATPVTDRTGIHAMQRKKQVESLSGTFSRGQVSAPKRW